MALTIEYAKMVNQPELNTYWEGINKDLTAVKNGITAQYNNGLAVGGVNKIKVIKRFMYGRNSFELLKAKVLLGNFHYIFNYLWKEPIYRILSIYRVT